MQKYDVIVVGAGNGGLSAALFFSSQTSSVAVLKKRPEPEKSDPGHARTVSVISKSYR